MLKGVSYGEVGITYVLHEGKIVNTNYVLQTKSKPQQSTGPPVIPFVRRT